MENRDLEFEITESVFLDDFKPVNEKLGILRNMGIQISLDDFGTGYSSLSSLRELNIDVVKIDKKFIDGILTDNKDSLIIPDIISMAHKTGLKVLAEGAEEEAQVEYLVESGCDIIQGYFYSKPLEFRDALEIVEKKFPPCSSTSS
jgi:EAL domain-containing protein (putative c-di-GMP-specific phosphodiesterase class I)